MLRPTTLRAASPTANAAPHPCMVAMCCRSVAPGVEKTVECAFYEFGPTRALQAACPAARLGGPVPDGLEPVTVPCTPFVGEHGVYSMAEVSQALESLGGLQSLIYLVQEPGAIPSWCVEGRPAGR